MQPTVLSALVVNPRRIGGVEMFCRELSAQLAERGWNSVLCFTAEPPAPVRAFLSLPNVTIEVIAGLDRSIPATLRAFRELLRKHRPGIVHLHFTPEMGGLAWMAGRSAGAVFATDHISLLEPGLERPAGVIKRAVSRLANLPLRKLIAVSDFKARECHASSLVPVEKITRIYNGVDSGRAHGNAAAFRARFGIPAGRWVVLQVSWMIPEKGVADFVEMARIVLREEPDTHFVLAGESRFREQLMRETAGLVDAARLTWTGLLEDPISDGVYDAADVVCQLSRWQEAFGWTTTEAMLCGRPVVATAVGATPEIVEHGESGFLVAPRQPAEAAARVVQLLRDPELRERMGARGRHIVRTKFDLRSNVAELVRLYGDAAAQRR